MEENKENVEKLETEEERYERAKEKLITDVRNARRELMSEFEDVGREMQARHESADAIQKRKKDLAEEKAARIADGFKSSERLSIMKKLLKDVHIAGEPEIRGKFEYLIMIGFKLQYWSKGDYAFKLNRKTEGIDEGFQEEQHRLEVEFEALEAEWNNFEQESSAE